MKKYRKILCGALVAALFLVPWTAGLAKPQVVYKGDENKPRIAITMDDCWKMQYVVEMLDLCKEYGFHMTFFPLGVCIKEKDGDIWRRMLSEGHEIGNHTQNHPKLNQIRSARIRKELSKMEDSLRLALGFPCDVRLMRPPGGHFQGGKGCTTVFVIEECGYSHVVMWSLSQTDPDKMLKKVKNGDILLYHSNRKDVEGLRKAIPILLERGFELVTVSELLGIQPEEEAASGTEKIQAQK
jgi:peptidoglycan/xylan/chitin deacetylase (PgdA/CDA1 family)